jgi:hypothetical protein
VEEQASTEQSQPATARDSDEIVFTSPQRCSLPNQVESSSSEPEQQEDEDVPPVNKVRPTAEARNPILELWLASIRLEEIAPLLLAAGYDDIEMMAEQMTSHMPITHDTLINIGITKPGHRARLLAHLIEGNSRSVPALHPPATHHSSRGLEFSCCALPRAAAEQPIFPTLQQWLKSIGLESLYPNFQAAGYDDFEQVIFLMDTNFSLNDAVLEHEVGVTRAGDRHRILIQLQ